MPDPLVDLARLEGVPSAVESARDAVDAVLRDRGLRRTSDEERAAARLAGAQASSRLESFDARDEQAEPWLAGTLRLYAELVELASSIRVTPPQVLARAHALLARDSVEESRLGRLRDSAQLADRITGLSALLTARTHAPVIVLAGVVHAELAVLRPFGSADGILARAVEHMILIDGGIDPPAAIVVEAGHLAAGPRYAERLTAYAAGSTVGVREWLLHCAAAIARGAEESPAHGRT